MTDPAVIGRWTLGGLLGTGGFARVYQAESAGQQYALKLCIRNDDPSRVRLDVEIEMLGQFDHPGIPRLIGHGTIDGRPYYVMTMAPGVSLQRSIEDHQRRGALHGDIESMRMIDKLLDVLGYVHGRRFVHRDVKDANVIVDGNGSLMLIDYGFCKREGTREIRSNDSYHRAGSPLYNPPAKLEQPGLAASAHDIFAVGVIAYRMLTSGFPWTAPPTEDRSALRQAQRSVPLVPPRDHNSHIDQSVSEFVSSLLTLNDRWRPTAQQAREVIAGFLTRVERDGLTSLRRRSTPSYPQVIRDPIYGDVRLSELEYRALLTKEMQHLRLVRQLGLTDMVYPGATHSRQAHSIGCVERVEQILTTVERQEGIRADDDLRLVARLYALTHDVTHVPFGHTIEDELGFFRRHDTNHARIDRLVDSPGSELGDLLSRSSMGRVVKDLLRGSAHPRWGIVLELVSGVTGADVQDYVDRDSYFCGLGHRIDTALLRQFRIQQTAETAGNRLVSLVTGKYGPRTDREFAVESVLRERYAMYLKVYTHSAKVAASALLGKALYGALHPIGRPRTPLREEQLETIGDETLLHMLAESRDSTVSSLAQRLLHRRLPSGVYRAPVVVDNAYSTAESMYGSEQARLTDLGVLDPQRRAQLEADIAARAKVSPDKVIIYCPTQAPGYQRLEHWVTDSTGESPTRHPAGFDYGGRHIRLWDLWVFVVDGSEADRTGVAEVAKDVFGKANVIDVSRRAGRL